MTRIRKIFEDVFSEVHTLSSFDLSRTIFFEVTFALLTFVLVVFKIYIPSLDLHIQALTLLLLWAFLALTGFFIPSVKETWILGVGGKNASDGRPITPGIPIQIEMESKGGFIAGRKIHLKAKVLDIDERHKTKEEFQKDYDELSVAFMNSTQLPLKKGRYLEGTPQAGGVQLKKDTLVNRSKIFFGSPGEFTPMLLFKKTGDPKTYGGPVPESLLRQTLKVSPAEGWVGLKNYAIMYSLTLIILMLTLVQLRLL